MLGLVVCLVVTEPVVLGVFVTCLFDAFVYVFVKVGSDSIGRRGMSTEIGSLFAYVIASIICVGYENQAPVVGEPIDKGFIDVLLLNTLPTLESPV